MKVKMGILRARWIQIGMGKGRWRRIRGGGGLTKIYTYKNVYKYV